MDTDIRHRADLSQRCKIISGGRIQIPSTMRRELSIEDGDTVLLSLVDGVLHVRSLEKVVHTVQDRLRSCLENGPSETHIPDATENEDKASQDD